MGSMYDSLLFLASFLFLHTFMYCYYIALVIIYAFGALLNSVYNFSMQPNWLQLVMELRSSKSCLPLLMILSLLTL